MKQTLTKALMGLAVVTALVGCAGEEDAVVMAPLPLVDNQFETQTEWRASVGDGVEHYFSRLAPLYAYDKVFVASRDGVVKALDPQEGDRVWKIELDDDQARLSGGLSAAYGKVYVGSENGQVYALDEETGDIQWQIHIDGEILSKPLADNNLIMINTSEGELVALNPDNGEQVWSITVDEPNLSLRGDSSPAAVSGGVFWGTANGRLAAAISERGQLLWQQSIGSPQGSTEIDRLVDVDSSPIIIGSDLFIVGINGNLTSIDLRSGKPRWKRRYSSAIDMATDGSDLFLVTDKDHLVAVDARSGTELWQNKQLQYRLLTAPKLIDGYLVVGDAEGYLHWLDPNSGDFVAQQEIDDSGFSVGPVALDDGYVIMTRDGDIKKLKIRR